MDDPIQQLKESKAKELPPELGAEFLGLTHRQKIIITRKLGEAAQAILAVQFNKPEDDALLIRQHAFLHGSLQAYRALLEFDAEQLEEIKDLKPTPDLPPIDPPSF